MDADRKNNSGQVMIISVIILVIIFIAILFLFDLQNIIRSKIKMETAEQAAALTAANWQKESLNLIGEINIVKACDVLLTDIPNSGSDIAEMVQSAGDALTEMQSRIAFTGPLIAFGSAQVAAKNNGVNIFDDSNNTVSKSVQGDMTNYVEKLTIDPRYLPPATSEFVNFYHWREPYTAMISNIAGQGIAVRPSGSFPGLESVNPRWLTDRFLYNAILGEMWCQPTLNTIIKYPDSYWGGKWWNVKYNNSNFPEESEIYTLGVEFSGGASTQNQIYNPALPHISSLANDRGLNTSNWANISEMKWCIYDSSWFEGNANYNGPDTIWWNGSTFLRADLKPSARYGGAVAYAECYQKVKTVNEYKSNMSRPTVPKDSSGAAKEQTQLASDSMKRNLIKNNQDFTITVGNDIRQDSTPGGAVAKAFGKLQGDLAPTDAVMVLPVFTDAALIPSTMHDYRPMRVGFSDLERFLIWLSGVDDLHSPETPPPDGTAAYLSALQKLDSERFRKTGWNNNFNIGAITSDVQYFSNQYKYSDTNSDGAGWLQQAYLQVDSKYDPMKPTVGVDERKTGWNTGYYYGGQYLLRNSAGALVTNEQAICRWIPGGPGVVPPGTRIGPPRL